MAATQGKDTSTHLKETDVRYLALEGGGGKGFAYLGALQLLDKKKILQRIQGVAGTSAGAITALMISLGMTSDEITKEVKGTDFTKFFDSATPRVMPKPTMDFGAPAKYEIREDSISEQAKLRSTGDPGAIRKFASDLQSESEKIGPGHLPGWIVWAGIAPLLRSVSEGSESLSSVLGYGASAVLGSPFDKLVADWQHYFTYLDRDMGFFSGLAAREYLDQLIAKRAAVIMNGKEETFRNLPFRLHKDIFKRELLVCGANLSTGKTVLFSARPEHTPNFPVADAVRISMSLPLIYKPYVISRKMPGWPECGTYVDGGLWNNIPLREIEPLPAGQDPASTGIRWPAQTLALRLEITPPSKISSALNVMSSMLQGIAGSGETQVLQELQYMCVTLDTRDLSLLKFKPEDDVSAKVLKRSKRQISRYFDWQIEQADLDPKDDRETEKMLNTSVCDS